MMWKNVKSQVDASNKNKRIEQLDQSAKSESEIIPLPLFEINYNFKSGHKVYLGIPLKDDPRPTVGYRHNLYDMGELDISAFYNLPETVWQDPFGYQNISLNAGGGYEKRDSNIDFYDRESSSILMTIGYRFGKNGYHNEDD